jgi:hypothetical protein
MITEIITPYTGSGTSISDAIRPLLVDVIDTAEYGDITGNQLANGIPAVNLLVITADVSGAQLSQIKSDNRFFVLEPGQGYSGSALVNWLAIKGAAGHGVTEGEAADTARSKVISYCKGL